MVGSVKGHGVCIRSSVNDFAKEKRQLRTVVKRGLLDPGKASANWDFCNSRHVMITTEKEPFCAETYAEACICPYIEFHSVKAATATQDLSCDSDQHMYQTPATNRM